MKSNNIQRLFKSKAVGELIILTASILLIYLLVSIYFTNHFFFGTVINGVDVSLKAHDEVEDLFRSYVRDYRLQLIERNGEIEEIVGQDIGMQFNEKDGIFKVCNMQKSLQWISPLFKSQKCFIYDLYIYNKDALENKIRGLNCLNSVVIEPQNVSFEYINGSYKAVKEIYGNKIIEDNLNRAIKMSILKGETRLDLNQRNCYENPKYTLGSDKTFLTRNLLNMYVNTRITYAFGKEREILDGSIINEWLGVDKNLDIVINKTSVMEYLKDLSKKYDTVGISRNFKTSMGKMIEVEGGLYGWKINRIAETAAIMENIKLGDVLEREPVYTQKALSRGEDEIGNTYIEINISRQRVWFYKEGRLIAQGAVVTGNPNRGHGTVLGTYMLNYKQKGTTLIGEDYEAEVTYWMPFFGNIGIHDASWRYSFGGQIYKRNGTHGCVNAPLYLAKRIYENIEPGTPIICYEE